MTARQPERSDLRLYSVSTLPKLLRIRKPALSVAVSVLLVVLAALPATLMACTSRPAAGSSQGSSSSPGSSGSILQSTDMRTLAIEKEIAKLVSLQTSQAGDFKLQLDAIQKQLNAIQKDIAEIKGKLK